MKIHGIECTTVADVRAAIATLGADPAHLAAIAQGQEIIARAEATIEDAPVRRDGSKIMLHGRIGAGLFTEGITAAAVARELRAAGGPVDVYINSAGGDPFAGHEIREVLAAHPHRVRVHVSLAASAGSLAAMGASKGELYIAANGSMMIHASRTAPGAAYTARDHRTKAEMLDTIDGTMRALYVARTGRPDAEIGALMDRETWMGSARAVALGFADKVTSVAPGARAIAMAQAGDIPAAVAEILGTDAPACESDPMLTAEQKAVRQRLRLAETATDAEVLAAVEALNVAPPVVAPPAVTAEAVASLVLAQLDTRETVRNASTAHADACSAAVERFIKDRKIAPKGRDKAIKACGATAESLSAAIAYWEDCSPILADATNVGSPDVESAISPMQKRMAKSAGVKIETIQAIRKEEIEAAQETR